MTGSNPDRPAEEQPPGPQRETAPESPRASPVLPPTPPGPRPVRGFGRRVRPPEPPAADPPAPVGPAPADSMPPSSGTTATGNSPPPVASAASAPSEPVPTGAQPDPSRLKDETYLAAEAARLGIKFGDDATGSVLDGDAKVLAEARRMGLRVGTESAADWQEPFDEEMERTAVLLGIRSEESLGAPAGAPRKVSKALPWVVLLFLLMSGLAVATLFIDDIIALFAAGAGP